MDRPLGHVDLPQNVKQRQGLTLKPRGSIASHTVLQGVSTTSQLFVALIVECEAFHPHPDAGLGVLKCPGVGV